jgi:hypothetical protein
MKRRPVTYPPAKTATKGAPPAGVWSDGSSRPSLVTIDATAGKGRPSLKVGARVRINGTGLYAGEVVVIERLIGGVIPAASVRTDSGAVRRVRAIDLEPAPAD